MLFFCICFFYFIRTLLQRRRSDNNGTISFSRCLSSKDSRRSDVRKRYAGTWRAVSVHRHSPRAPSDRLPPVGRNISRPTIKLGHTLMITSRELASRFVNPRHVTPVQLNRLIHTVFIRNTLTSTHVIYFYFSIVSHILMLRDIKLISESVKAWFKPIYKQFFFFFY